MKLHKYLAKCGVASLRACEKHILAGKVKVNGKVITELGTFVEPGADEVLFEGRPVAQEQLFYIVMNKPRGVVTTVSDPQGRPTVFDIVKKSVKTRVYPVGRLDYNTTGLLILTNDGAFANYVMQAKNRVLKSYVAKIRGELESRTKSRLLAGIRLEDGVAKADSIRFIKKVGNNSWIEISLHQGKNRIVRRMLETVGHPVSKLRRVRIGKLELRGIALGEFRFVTQDFLYKKVGFYEGTKRTKR